MGQTNSISNLPEYQLVSQKKIKPFGDVQILKDKSSYKLCMLRQFNFADSQALGQTVQLLANRIQISFNQHLLSVILQKKAQVKGSCLTSQALLVFSQEVQSSLQDRIAQLHQRGSYMNEQSIWNLIEDIFLSFKTLNQQNLDYLPLQLQNIVCTKRGFRLIDRHFLLQFHKKPQKQAFQLQTEVGAVLSSEQIKSVGRVVQKIVQKFKSSYEKSNLKFLQLKDFASKLALSQLNNLQINSILKSRKNKQFAPAQLYRYEGSYFNGLYHGIGQLYNNHPLNIPVTIANIGDIYEIAFTVYRGHFQQGKKHGFGMMSFSKGVKLIGLFKDNMPEGIMVFEDSNGCKQRVSFMMGRKI